MSERTDSNLDLEWIELKEQMNRRHANEESTASRFVSKFKSNPLVPIGITATTFCLGYGLICMRRGDSKKQQLMMRGRVLAQGFTVLALVSGIMLSLVNRQKQT